MIETIPHSIIYSVFGDRSTHIRFYHDFLLSEGIKRGLIGPREGDRLWSRHIFNSALLAQLIPDNSTVVDIGSGAGLPGIPVFLANPSLRIYLLEPLQRRVRFLEECIEFLADYPNISVIHAKAQSEYIQHNMPQCDYIIARAVSSLTNLAQWSLPLLSQRGELLALKGKNVYAEIEDHMTNLSRLGFQHPVVETLFLPNTDISAIVVRVRLK